MCDANQPRECPKCAALRALIEDGRGTYLGNPAGTVAIDYHRAIAILDDPWEQP